MDWLQQLQELANIEAVREHIQKLLRGLVDTGRVPPN